MKDKRLEDYIATLSESEKEQYKCLIEESRQRGIAMKKNCDELRINLLALFVIMKKAVFFSEQHDRDLLQHHPKSLN